MRVVLTAVGTEGDVGPMAAIGRELTYRGHEVTLLTQEPYRHRFGGADLDVEAVSSEDDFKRFKADLPLLNIPPTVPEFFRRHYLPSVEREYTAICSHLQTARGVIVANETPGFAARMAAESCKCPLVTILTFPRHARTGSLVEYLVGTILWPDVSAARARIGLPEPSDRIAWWRHRASSIGLWPDWFMDVRTEWNGRLVQAGFVWHRDASGTDVEAALGRLNPSVPTALVTAGTGPFSGSSFFAAALGGCMLAGFQCLVATDYPSLLPAPLDERVHWVRRVSDLASVMERVDMVVHHGGMGTIGQALAAARPQLILGAGIDRPENGATLQRLGVAVFLDRSRWNANDASEAIRRLTLSPDTQRRCEGLAARLQHERGLWVACDEVESAGSINFS